MQLDKKKIVRTALFAVLVGALGYSFVAKSETKLIPFQGKLTDASGQVISDGAIVVQFKMYDAPVGGQAKWNGEVQMLSVNGGLVNTTLGTKASLKNVDFSSPTYLEITIDANGDNQIGPEDPPLLPRQSIIPAVYAVQAGDANKLSGYDWSSIFGTNDPTGKIPGDKLADGSITGTQIASKTITAQQIKDSTITSAKLANGSVTSSQLAKNSVTTDKLALGAVTGDRLAENSVTSDKIAENEVEWKHRKTRTVVTNSLAVEPQIGQIVKGESVTAENSTQQVMQGSKVQLKTSGGPVYVGLEGDMFFFTQNSWIRVEIVRDGTTVVYDTHFGVDVTYTAGLPPSIVHYIDYPEPGLHEYKYTFRKHGANGSVRLDNIRIVAFEL